MEEVNNVLEQFLEFVKKQEIVNSCTSHLFNPLVKFASIRETTHSRILAFLLNKHESHGQGDLFLKTFLAELNIDYYEGETWYISAEQDRVDVLLRTEDNSKVIVIENKSHNAVDQQSQLYRNWAKHIYPHCKDANDKERFRLLYLSRNDWKKPSPNSLKKPEDAHYTLHPEEIPNDILTHWSFDNQLAKWLAEFKRHVPEENLNLHLFLKNYINLIKPKYYLMEMANKIFSGENGLEKWRSFMALIDVRLNLENEWMTFFRVRMDNYFKKEPNFMFVEDEVRTYDSNGWFQFYWMLNEPEKEDVNHEYIIFVAFELVNMRYSVFVPIKVYGVEFPEVKAVSTFRKNHRQHNYPYIRTFEMNGVNNHSDLLWYCAHEPERIMKKVQEDVNKIMEEKWVNELRNLKKVCKFNDYLFS